MKKLTKVLTVSAIAVGTAVVLKKVFEKDLVQDKFKEKAALDYLKEQYGEDALEGKKVKLVNKDDHATKGTIAKDIAEYNFNKDE